MKTNKDMYTVKITGNGGFECSLTGECEMISDYDIKINITEVYNDKILCDWIKSYSDTATGIIQYVYMLRKDVTLVNANDEHTILYNSMLISCEFSEKFENIESIQLKFQYMGGKLIKYIKPTKLIIEIDNITEEHVDKINDLFSEWREIIKNNDSRWTSFFIEKDFSPNIKISSE